MLLILEMSSTGKCSTLTSFKASQEAETIQKPERQAFCCEKSVQLNYPVVLTICNLTNISAP